MSFYCQWGTVKGTAVKRLHTSPAGQPRNPLNFEKARISIQEIDNKRFNWEFLAFLTFEDCCLQEYITHFLAVTGLIAIKLQRREMLIITFT